MKLKGWNEVPDGFDLEISFDLGPKWLEIMALTPGLERIAYPIGVNKGCVYLRVSESLESATSSNIDGWEVEANPKSVQEKFLEGSLAFMNSSQDNQMAQSKSLPRISITRWGRIKATRKWLHKQNGTYGFYKTKTFPTNLI
jgi:hypothetical protein